MKIETTTEKILFETEMENSSRSSKVTYGLVKEVYYLNGRKSRKAYGVAGYANSEEDGTLTIVWSANDLSTDRKAVSELVERLNESDVSPIHLPDIIQDFLP